MVHIPRPLTGGLGCNAVVVVAFIEGKASTMILLANAFRLGL